MKRLKPLALCLALLLAAPLIYAPLTPKAEAMEVIDNTLIELTKVSWVKQVADMAMQIDQYQRLLKRLDTSDIGHLIGDDAFNKFVAWFNYYQDAQHVADYKKKYPDFLAAAANNFNGIDYKIEQVDSNTNKKRINIGEYQRYRNDLLQNTKQQLQEAMLMQDMEAKAREADFQTLSALQAKAATAIGAVEAMQINSQIVALQTKIQLRQQAMAAAANKAQAAATLNQMQADELASVTMNRQIVADSAQWKERGAPGGKPLALTGILALLFGKTSPIEYRVEAHL